MQKTTVLINGRFLTQQVTGVQRYAYETLLALDRALDDGESTRIEFVVVAPRNAEPPKELHNVAFEPVGRLTGNAWEQLELPWRARGCWLISFGPSGPLLKKHQLITVHDTLVYAFPKTFSWRFRLWYKSLLPILLRRTSCVMTVSRFSKSEIERHLGRPGLEIAVSHEGWQHVRRPIADDSVLREHRLGKDSYVLAVGSLSQHKNLKVVVRAVAKLEDPPFRVVVAGGVDAHVFGAAGTPASPALQWIGYVDDAKLRALYENALAFVFPSIYEGFGIPPLEAMALGCPVIASSAAAIPEVCGDAALYFEPDDADRLAELMSRLALDISERDALIAKGRKRLDQHSWEAGARAYLAVLARLLDVAGKDVAGKDVAGEDVAGEIDSGGV